MGCKNPLFQPIYFVVEEFESCSIDSQLIDGKDKTRRQRSDSFPFSLIFKEKWA